MPKKKAETAKPAKAETKTAETKKKAEPAEFEPSDFGVGPDDPNYQRPAFATKEEQKVLSEGPDARREAVLADIKKMHGG